MTVYNVANATGNASTDTAAIQAALTAANGDLGSIVYLGTGTYMINASLLIGSRTELKGHGIDSTIIKEINNIGWTSGALTPMLGPIGGVVHDISIHDITFDGNEAGQTQLNGTRDNGGGNGNSTVIKIYGNSGSSGQVYNINIYNCKMINSKGDGVRIEWGKNINVYSNIMKNLQHCCIYLINVNSGSIHDNTEQALACSGDRLGGCQNFTIYNENIGLYSGSTQYPMNHSGFAECGNAIQIEGSSTSNIIVKNSTLKGGVNGIWLTGAGNINIYNNTINDSGNDNQAVGYNGGIGISACLSGITIQNNIFSGCYYSAINVNSAASGNAIINVKNNNILNTRSVDFNNSSGVSISGSFAIKNKTTTVSLNLYHNYLSGNPVNYSPAMTDSSPATSANGAYDDGGSSSGGSTGGGTGGNTGPVEPYISRARVQKETLSDYFFTNYKQYNPDGSLRTSYINQRAIDIQSYTPNTPKTVSSNKPPGYDGCNLGIYGYGGSDVTLDLIADGLEDAWEIVAAFEGRYPAILELGGAYSGWFLSGVLAKPQSQISYSRGIVPSKQYPFSLLFQTDTPFFKSTIERIRTKHIFETSQTWSSADTPTGNQLKNYNFEAWSAGMSDSAPDWWTLETMGQFMSDNTHEGLGFSYGIIGIGTFPDMGSITQPVSCDSGTTYMLKASGCCSGVTQGQLIVECYAGGAVVCSVSWSTESDFTDKQTTIRFDVAPADAVIRIHATGTPNTGANFYLDNIYFGKASDLETLDTGTDIISDGEMYVIPDFEVRAVASSSTATTQDVAGTQRVSINSTDGANNGTVTNTYSTTQTAYNSSSLQLTTTLAALSGSGKFRIDNLSCTMCTDNATYTASCEVTIQAPSLYSGAETKIAEWTSGAVLTTYEAKTTAITGLTSANEQVIIRWYIKTTNSSHHAYAKSLTLKYTPLTPSSGYGDVAGTQLTYTYDPSEVYTSAETTFSADSKQYEVVITPKTGNKVRLDGLSCQLAMVAAGTASLQVTAQSATKYPSETIIIGPWTSTTIDPAFSTKTVAYNTQLFAVNEAVTLRWYLKTSNANRAVVKLMTYKYTPMYPQTPPDPLSGTNSISVYNVADPTTILTLANNLLPSYTVGTNGDGTGYCSCSLGFDDDTYLRVVGYRSGDVYSQANRTLRLAADCYVEFVVDTVNTITGIPFVEIFVISGAPGVMISPDGLAWYAVKGNSTTSVTNTTIYRELDADGFHLKGLTSFRILVSGYTGSSGCTIASYYMYADTVNKTSVIPKILPKQVNTFASILSGNPVDVTIRYRDSNLVV